MYFYGPKGVANVPDRNVAGAGGMTLGAIGGGESSAWAGGIIGGIISGPSGAAIGAGIGGLGGAGVGAHYGEGRAEAL